MEMILDFLKSCGTFYLATSEGGQPRVRPFGAVTAYEGKLYFVTNNKKELFKQLLDNSSFEISGMSKDKWIRLSGEAVHDDNLAAREKMLETYPPLTKMYAANDGIMEVFYIANATAKICSMTGEPEVIQF